jgi:hypothetical protein
VSGCSLPVFSGQGNAGTTARDSIVKGKRGY